MEVRLDRSSGRIMGFWPEVNGEIRKLFYPGMEFGVHGWIYLIGQFVLNGVEVEISGADSKTC